MATQPEMTISHLSPRVWGHMTNSPSGVCAISGSRGLSFQYTPPLSSEIMSEVHVERDGITVWKESGSLSPTW